MLTLKLSDDSKVRFKKNHRNTFGLMYGLPENGGTCPGATTGNGGCLALKVAGGKIATCYMDNLVRAYPSLGGVLRYNTDLLKGKSVKEMDEILTATFEEFVRTDKGENPYFRATYSGDLFSEDFAKALGKAINKFPNIQFWLYTRSLFAISILVEYKNLALYVSADKYNFNEAFTTYVTYRTAGYNNIGISFLGDTKEVPKELKLTTCPAEEIKKKLKAEGSDMGACAKCRLCFTYGKKIALRNIHFKVH